MGPHRAPTSQLEPDERQEFWRACSRDPTRNRPLAEDLWDPVPRGVVEQLAEEQTAPEPARPQYWQAPPMDRPDHHDDDP